MSRSCSGQKQWYVCSQGPFQGCCSVDPCASGGVCPDDDDDKSTTTKHTSSYTMVRTVTLTTSGSSTLSTVASNVTTTGRPDTTDLHGTTAASTTSTDTSAADNVGSEAEGSKGTPIGPIVGGVIGAIVFLIVLIMVLIFAYRRRKKRVRRFTLLRWHTPLTDDDKEGPFEIDTRPPQNDRMTTEQEIHSMPSRLLNFSNLYGVRQMTFSLSAPLKKEKAEVSSLLTPTDYSTNGTTPTSPTSTAAELNAYHLYPPSPYAPFSCSNASTSELSDTGVHRPRAELASPPTRELINVPQQQRPSSNQSILSLGRSNPGCVELAAQPCRELINVPPRQRQQPLTLPASPQGQLDSTCTSPPPVITADGVVLTANFDASLPESSSGHGTLSSHAMGFMDYETARRSMFSAHRPEWEG
ncbi:hypothetical protein ETB97_005268 [Aspergillus alliaceus]|uniref:Uncharacterized protein n=1 Tax=Petromyces alliaceus TaxID=209559 RepID=A0A8H6E354_PETAA|nr:hypothetical protein ETB97_005268 [Aspergillus burnettii]